jgi:hypothetical protein
VWNLTHTFGSGMSRIILFKAAKCSTDEFYIKVWEDCFKGVRIAYTSTTHLRFFSGCAVKTGDFWEVI